MVVKITTGKVRVLALNEVAPPGWGHTKAEKEKTKPDKPKSKIGGSAAAFKRALDDGRFKGLPGDKTKKEKTASMFKLMWSMKKKGAKPHYKPGTDEKKKKYQEEEVTYKQRDKELKKSKKAMDYRHKTIHKGGDDDVNEELIDEKFGQWKQAVKDRDKAHRESRGSGYRRKAPKQGSIKSRVKKGVGRVPLKDVNTPAKKQSMQGVGGFRGVHGASRKSKAAQGKPAPVIYSYKKKVDEGMTPMKDNNLFGNAYAGSYETLKKKIGSKKKHNKPAVEESFKSFMADAQAAKDRLAKKVEDRKKKDAQFVDTKKHGVRFYDKKGKGRIKSGKKIYD